MKPHKYLITGASGFIGGSLFDFLNEQHASVIGVGRSHRSESNYFQCDIFNNARLKQLLQDVTCIVHCAGYAHAFHLPIDEEKDLSRKINYEATENLARLAAELGVSTFIHLSSVKAMGKVANLCVDESWEHPPESHYGKYKLAAEKIVSYLGRQFGMRVINLRLSMVYGSGGKGNLERMARYVFQNIFPPLPETNNHRSMVHIQDVIQAILCVSQNDLLDNELFIISGPDAPSGRQLYDQIRKAYGMRPIHIQVPHKLLYLLASICEILQHILRRRLPFNHDVLDKLLSSEWYSSKKLQSMLNWMPTVTLEMGLMEMVQDHSKSSFK